MSEGTGIDTGKGQLVRLVDVFLLGPFMIWYGFASEGVLPWAKGMLVAAGVLTITYNGKNYWEALRAGENGNGLGVPGLSQYPYP